MPSDLYDHLMRCETCGELVDETEIRYDKKTDTIWCTQPNCDGK